MPSVACLQLHYYLDVYESSMVVATTKQKLPVYPIKFAYKGYIYTSFEIIQNLQLHLHSRHVDVNAQFVHCKMQFIQQLVFEDQKENFTQFIWEKVALQNNNFPILIRIKSQNNVLEGHGKIPEQ